MNTYKQRKINIKIALAIDAKGDATGDEVTLSGLRASVLTTAYTGDMQAALQLRVYGMTLEMMNRLTILNGEENQRRNNQITITAGDDGHMATVYQGVILTAFGEFRSAPDVVFNVMAQAGIRDAVKKAPPSAYKGTFDAADALAALAKIMEPQPQGLTFENSGVSVMLENRTYNGTALMQVKEIVREAQIDYTIERGKMAIWPRRKYRKGDPIKVSEATGMIGYPSYSGNGIELSTIFNPNIAEGGRVEVTSELTPACGVWNVVHVSHVIESETPGGQWFTHILCTREVA